MVPDWGPTSGRQEGRAWLACFGIRPVMSKSIYATGASHCGDPSLSQACDRPGTNKLFVGGLPQNTAAAELREHFEVHVPATQITVCLPGADMLRASESTEPDPSRIAVMGFVR